MTQEYASLKTLWAGPEAQAVEVRGLFDAKTVQGYVPTPESEQLRVQLNTFEGPLDLLLFSY
jgi:hypothetical protein